MYYPREQSVSENVFYISCSTCVSHQVEPLNFKH